MTRKSINVEGFNHGANPIPAASRVGDIVVTGGVHGMDPQTGKITGGLEEQAKMVFANLRRILEAAEASLDDVVRVTVYLRDHSARSALNPEWLEAFPDPDSRPARHVLINEHLPPGVMMQCDAIAVISHD